MIYQRVKLGEVCDFIHGDGLPEAQRRGGAVPVYGSNGIVGWHDSALTRGKTIIIGRKGSIGEVSFSKLPCWPIDTTYYIEVTKKTCQLLWLYYMLIALDLTKLNKSAAVPGLNRDDAYEKEIPYHILPEQKRIAAILAKADRLRRQRQYALELSGTYLQSVFLDMFGDPVTNPMGWDIVQLGDMLSISPHLGTITPAKESGTQLCVRVGEVGQWSINLEKCKYVSLGEKDFKRFSLQPGDIVLARAIGSEAHLGKLSIMGKSSIPVVFDSHLMRIRTDSSSLLPFFLACWLKTDGGRARFMRQARQTSVQFNINTEQIASIELPVPPVLLQQKFVKIIGKYLRLQVQQREALRQAEHLFQTLLHKAFQGELSSEEKEIEGMEPIDRGALQMALWGE
jgi:type I restriction enzyme, S subunit